MKAIGIRTATAALVAATLLPVAGFAQSGDRSQPNFNPYAGAGTAPVCTQLELSIGISGDECGQLSPTELTALKADRDNTN